MPTYRYKAISKKGEYVSGKESAQSSSDLARMLREKGYVLTDAEEEGAKKQARNPLPSFLFGVSLQDKLIFMRNLKVMVGAGIGLPKTLEVLEAQASSKKLKKALRDMREKVLQGHQLSETMQAYPDIFPALFVNMIRTGEESGTLENVLSQLALQLEREHDLKSKIQGALMYPAVIVIAMIGIGTLMLVLVVPQLARTFKDLGVELPLTTRFVIGFADFLVNFWYIAIVLVLLAIVGLYQLIRSKTGKEALDAVVLRLPVFGNIVKKINTAFFARTLSSLIGAGIPIVRSLEVTSTVLQNTKFQEVLLLASKEMRKGTKLSEVLSRHTNLYPLVVVQMLEVGEETGQTSDLLAKLADFFEEEVATITKNLASIIEPLLMLIIGAVVGFFAVSMIQPMYSMLGNV